MKRFLALFLLSFLTFLTPFAATAQQTVQRTIINPSFEDPTIDSGTSTSNPGCQGYVYASRVPGWKTTDPTISQSTAGFDSPNNCVGTNPTGSTQVFEFFSNWVRDNQSRIYLLAASGTQFVELQAETASRLYQNVCFVPGETVNFSFSHLGRLSANTPDVARFMIGGTARGTGTVILTASDSNDGSPGSVTPGLSTNATRVSRDSASPNTTRSWGYYSGSFVVPANLGGTQQIGFDPVSSSNSSHASVTNSPYGNFLDNITVTMKPVIEFASASYTSVESNASAPSIQFRVAGVVPTGGVPVSVTVTPTTAALGSDFTINGGTNATFTYTIPAGDYGTGTLVSAGIPVALVNDTATEPTETFSAKINTSANYVISSTTACNGTATASTNYTITDDDLQITLTKKWVNPIPNDTVNLSISGGTSSSSGTSRAGAPTETNATATAAAGAALTLSETLTAGAAGAYSTTFSCTLDSNGSAVTLSGSGLSRTLTMPTGSISCTVTNSRANPTGSLPPAWTSAKTCPAANPLSKNIVRQVGWQHNAPANTLNPDEGARTDFPIADPVGWGPGITYTPQNTAGIARLVDTTTAEAANAAGDYVSYHVRTGANTGVRTLKTVRWIVLYQNQWSKGYPYKFAILVSDNPNFTSAQVILRDEVAPYKDTGSWEFFTRDVPPAARILLQPNTDYYFRVLLYDTQATPVDYDTAVWDDFSIDTADCETQPVQLAKVWTNATAGHQATATATGAINGTNPTFASTAPAAVTGTAVNLFKGEAITLPAETFAGGATAAMYNSTVSCTGGSPLASGAVGRTLTIANSDTATVCTYSNVFTGPLKLTKTSAPYWDPSNNMTNPKMIPGAYVNYTLKVESPAITVTSNSVIVTDALPAQVSLCVAAVGQCSAPVTWQVSTSGLTYTYGTLGSTTDDVSFSTDGVNWGYTPIVGADGTDPAVRYIRVNPKGAMNPSSDFSIILRTLIK